MAQSDSTIYTIGTALRRAQDADLSVELLVGGQWTSGLINAMDGHGVVLYGSDDELAIIRMASIDAMRVRNGAAFEGRAQVEAHHDDPLAEREAHPMPAARADRD